MEGMRGGGAWRDGVFSQRSGGGWSCSLTIIFNTSAVLFSRDTMVCGRPNPERRAISSSDKTSCAEPRAYKRKRRNSRIVPRPHASAIFAGTETAALMSWSPSVNRSDGPNLRTCPMTPVATEAAISCTRSEPALARRTIAKNAESGELSWYQFYAVPPRFSSTSSLHVVPQRRLPS